MPKKHRKDFFVPLPPGFTVETPAHNLKGELFRWKPTGLFVVVGHDRAELHYAGDKAGESALQFDIPSSPEFLRDLAQRLIVKADELDAE